MLLEEFVKALAIFTFMKKLEEYFCLHFSNKNLFFKIIKMTKFFDTTSDGDGFLIRKLTNELVLNNIYWIAIKEKDVTDNFFIPDRIKMKERIL